MKSLKYFVSALLVCSACVGFYACSDDDEGGSGSASSTAGVLDKKTGLRVRGYDGYSFYYDEKGRIDYIRDSYGQWSFSYNPNTISFLDNYGGETLKVSYNGSGYLASTSESWSEQGDSYKSTGSSQASLSYDGSGHLTKISLSEKEKKVEGGETWEETWTTTYTLTWRNNLLQQVVYKEKGVEDGDTWEETETIVYAYDNEDYENVYRQWAPFLDWEGDIEELLAYAGLLGIGPNKLPSSAEYEEVEIENGKRYTDNGSNTYRYGFNSDGSISYAMVNGSRYNFSYDYAETSDNKTRAAVQDVEVARLLHHLFRKAHRR